MKFLFTAPRFHTNQVPIVKGLVEKGHEVRYFVVYVGVTEDHTDCNPLVLKPSRTTIREIRKLENRRDAGDIETFMGGNFIPNISALKQVFEDYMPDVVICREKTFLTLCVKNLCDKHKIPCILYNQEPLYDLTRRTAVQGVSPQTYSLLKRIIIKVTRTMNSDLRMLQRMKKSTGFPTVRITPVKYRGLLKPMSEFKNSQNDPRNVVGKDNSDIPRNGSFYVPLVYSISSQEKKHYPKVIGSVRFLCVAKYRPYKNLTFLINTFSEIKDRKDWSLTIVGQMNEQDEKRYHDNLLIDISSFGLQDRVTLLPAMDYKKMNQFYREFDVLILPSRKETYGMSVTEGMANGLCVISSHTCGVSFNVIEGSCGIVFESNNIDSLKRELIALLDRKTMIPEYGENAYRYISREQSFARYYQYLTECLNYAFGNETT